MSNKKGVDLAILIVNLLGIALCIVAGLFLVFRDPGNMLMTVTAILTVLALLAALLYIVKGAKKNAAAFFKFFMSFYALAEFSSVISATSLTVGQPIAVAVHAAMFGLLILLASGKDLGRLKSFLLCGGTLLLALVLLVGAIRLFGGTPFGLILTLRAGANLVLAVLTCIMVIAKYADKASRGRD